MFGPEMFGPEMVGTEAEVRWDLVEPPVEAAAEVDPAPPPEASGLRVPEGAPDATVVQPPYAEPLAEPSADPVLPPAGPSATTLSGCSTMTSTRSERRPGSVSVRILNAMRSRGRPRCAR